MGARYRAIVDLLEQRMQRTAQTCAWNNIKMNIAGFQ
jgi:hypothetical protein